MATLAKEIAAELDEYFPRTLEEKMQDQGMCVMEEAGEFVGALRRYMGKARRTGTLEEVAGELADVVITAWVAAHYLGIDLWDAFDKKAAVIRTRGWKDPR